MSDKELANELHAAGSAFSAIGVTLDVPGLREFAALLLEAGRRLDRVGESEALAADTNSRRQAYQL